MFPGYGSPAGKKEIFPDKELDLCSLLGEVSPTNKTSKQEASKIVLVRISLLNLTVKNNIHNIHNNMLYTIILS